MSKLYIVTQVVRGTRNPVGTLYREMCEHSFSKQNIIRIDGYRASQLILLPDLTSRVGVESDGHILYRFASAPNLVTLLFVGENGN